MEMFHLTWLLISLEGMKLASLCNDILEKANETVTKVMEKDGTLKKFEIDE